MLNSEGWDKRLDPVAEPHNSNTRILVPANARHHTTLPAKTIKFHKNTAHG